MSEQRIGIGINENVFLAKITVSEKGSLELHWDRSEEGAEATDLFSDLTSGEIQEDSGIKTTIWAPLLPDKKDLTEEKKIDRVTSDIEATKNQLIHIMESYMTKDKVKPAFTGTFDGTPITDSKTLKQFILDQSVIDIVTKNIFDAFIKGMADFVGKPELKKRLLLVRQSKDKAFATLRKYYLRENPFLEDMEIPQAQSKLKFTKYELKEGLDDDTPVSRGSADKDAGGGAATESTSAGSPSPEEIFGRS